MRRGDHPGHQGRWRITLEVQTAIDRDGRERLNYAEPTGSLSLLPEPWKSPLRGLLAGTAPVPSKTMTVFRFLRGRYEEDRREAIARVQAGDGEALFAFIGSDEHRLHDREVLKALGEWVAEQIPRIGLSAVLQKLHEVEKQVHPIHLADGRRLLAALGEQMYQGRPIKNALEHAGDWDPKREERGGKGRHPDTLAEQLDKWRWHFGREWESLSSRYLAGATGPAGPIRRVT